MTARGLCRKSPSGSTCRDGLASTTLRFSRPRRAARGDVRRKQKGFAERDDFRLIAHLGALIVEAGEVGREQVAGDDLDAGLLECGDLRREVVAESGELPRI